MCWSKGSQKCFAQPSFFLTSAPVQYPTQLHSFFMSKTTCSTPHIPTPGRPCTDPQAKAALLHCTARDTTGFKSTTSYNLLKTRNTYMPSTSPGDARFRWPLDTVLPLFSSRDKRYKLGVQFYLGCSNSMFAVDAGVPEITQTEAYCLLKVKEEPSLKKNTSLHRWWTSCCSPVRTPTGLYQLGR